MIFLHQINFLISGLLNHNSEVVVLLN